MLNSCSHFALWPYYRYQTYTLIDYMHMALYIYIAILRAQGCLMILFCKGQACLIRLNNHVLVIQAVLQINKRKSIGHYLLSYVCLYSLSLSLSLSIPSSPRPCYFYEYILLTLTLCHANVRLNLYYS